MAATFYNLNSEAGLKKLNEYLLTGTKPRMMISLSIWPFHPSHHQNTQMYLVAEESPETPATNDLKADAEVDDDDDVDFLDLKPWDDETADMAKLEEAVKR
ncbi:hypothetical protein GIB67_013700 [Kingdonia uniflora]|uniref:Uncharacterized protein n=1 Tax=Kingdonia uniflora TaxID=39325 RepID=A0A7J7NQE2_9MAGN|nr:hypothetical protein GIB67_013700 [Kingdonia uniflora]